MSYWTHAHLPKNLPRTRKQFRHALLRCISPLRALFHVQQASGRKHGEQGADLFFYPKFDGAMKTNRRAFRVRISIVADTRGPLEKLGGALDREEESDD